MQELTNETLNTRSRARETAMTTTQASDKPTVRVVMPDGTEDEYRAETIEQLKGSIELGSGISDVRFIRGESVLSASSVLKQGDRISVMPLLRGASKLEAPSSSFSTEMSPTERAVREIENVVEKITKPKKIIQKPILRDLTKRSNAPMAEVIVTPRALHHLVSILYNLNTEFGFHALGYRINSQKIVLSDVYVPTQHVAASTWEIMEKGLVEIATKYNNADQNIGWGHSHNDMDAFHSHVDIDTDEKVFSMYKLPVISLTVSRKLGDWDCFFFTKRFQEVWKLQARLDFGYNIYEDLDRLHENSYHEKHYHDSLPKSNKTRGEFDFRSGDLN